MKNANPLYQNIGDELKLGLLTSIEVIQTLWGGYGQLIRLEFNNTSIIIKHINLPKTNNHPYGWNTDFSHKRKLHSYKVEVNWYEEFTKTIDIRCPMPKGLKTFQTQNEYLIVMEDLASLGFDYIPKKANKNHLKSALFWLANFHAKYMGCKSSSLWKVGTYWHLDTRPDELEALKDKELKKLALDIDTILKNTKYQTIVHGDAKLANFCFNKTGTLSSAVDFQYVGHGCGMKDVILFMSSAINPKDCANMQNWVLDTYFDALFDALEYYHPNINGLEVQKEWRDLFSVSWADFQRFIKGWSPNHFKINPYTEALTKRALEYVKSR